MIRLGSNENPDKSKFYLRAGLSMKTYHNFDLIYPVSLISSIAGWAVHK
jgi:hypothetical protein